MKRIKLTQGKFALVDDNDFENLNKYNWYTDKRGDTFYARRKFPMGGGKQTSVGMHTMIMGIPKGMSTDHIDGNGLNNQRDNLRVCTSGENQRNRGKTIRNTSGFKGVHWSKRDRRWQARIGVDGTRIYLGNFKNKIDAYDAYCRGCERFHGNFSKKEGKNG